MEDANFSMEMTCQLKPGVPEKCVQGPPDANKWFRQRYTLWETLGEPGDAEKTTMSAFYQHLEIGILRENG